VLVGTIIESPWLVNGGHGASLIAAARCRSKLRLDTLPYWSQIEVCMHLRPLTVRDALCP
jgi:hypothetical protein